MSGGKKHVRCAMPSCLESQRSLYHLPKDRATRTEWLEFIFNYNVPDTYSPHMLVCCQHFESSCFANEAQYNAGFASKLLLLPGAVPTIDLPGAIRTIDIHGAVVDLRCPPAAAAAAPAPHVQPVSKGLWCHGGDLWFSGGIIVSTSEKRGRSGGSRATLLTSLELAP
ncbi:hypothetical protein CRUP_008203 [Coryphaenoides rupestris]|nr:hypothetical protein CRUP_027700 [Coryphaenoides rupestris]KAG7221419.1 hypothetical protein CRUP_008203 [Coryphaenoides rupestris]